MKTILEKDQEYQKKLERIVQRIKKEYKPEKIILFGSFAYGKPNKNSDVDLFIIKKTKADRYKRQLKVRRLIKGELPVDVLVYAPEEVNQRSDMGDFFIKNILSKGKVLYNSLERSDKNDSKR